MAAGSMLGPCQSRELAEMIMLCARTWASYGAVTVLDFAGHGSDAHWELQRAMAELTPWSGVEPPRLHACAPGDLQPVPDAPLPDGGKLRRDGPLIVLAHDLWAAQDQQLLTVHYGELYLLHPAPAQAWRKLAIDEIPIDARDCMHAYLCGLNAAQFTYPWQAIRTLDAVASWTTAPWLVHANSSGWASLADLRADSGLSHIITARTGGRLPVNHEAIARHAARRGWLALQSRADDRRVSQCIGAPMQELRALERAAVPGITDESLSSSSAMQTLLRAGQVRQALSVLRCAGHDPRLIQGAADLLYAAMQGLGPAELENWSAALGLAWDACPPGLRREMAQDITMLALQCHAIALARDACACLHARRATQTRSWSWIALTHEASGRPAAAYRAWRRIGVEQAAHGIQGMARATQRMHLASGPHGTWDARGIRLEAMDHGHARALLHQYRDPQISVMVALPRWDSVAAVQQWLDNQSRETLLWTAVHRRHGLVGFASIGHRRGLGFFSFWVGPSFQGHGYAKSIAAAACHAASRAGLDVVVTSVYDDNIRSLRALLGAGYQPIALRAKPPDDRRRFLVNMLGHPGNVPATAVSGVERRIIDFCHALPDAMRFEIPQARGPQPDTTILPVATRSLEITA